MSYPIIGHGFVCRRQPGTATSSLGGARCAVGRQGEIVCSFIGQTALGKNDFKPMLARSTDGGVSWSEPRLIWPELVGRYSIFGSISRAPSGDFLFYGSRTPIDSPGESFWSDATQGLKQNELIWSQSSDDGKTWDQLKPIPMPIAGSAEAPGPLCATRSGGLACCYAPYNTFDPKVSVARNQIVCLSSADRGKSWAHSAMLRFAQADSTGAEAWVVELADGRLLGTSWHIREGEDPPNAYALSHDGGKSWGPTRSTGTLGQSTALTPLPDGRVLFAYNQRKFGDIGVWLAIANPTESDFGLQSNHRIWASEIASNKPGAIGHKTWTDFSFGEPAATLLPDGSVLVVLWSAQPSGYGIPYVKLRLA